MEGQLICDGLRCICEASPLWAPPSHRITVCTATYASRVVSGSPKASLQSPQKCCPLEDFWSALLLTHKMW